MLNDLTKQAARGAAEPTIGELVEEAQAAMRRLDRRLSQHQEVAETESWRLMQRLRSVDEWWQRHPDGYEAWLVSRGARPHKSITNPCWRLIKALACDDISRPQIHYRAKVLAVLRQRNIPANAVLEELAKREPVGAGRRPKSGLARLRAIYDLEHAPKARRGGAVAPKAGGEPVSLREWPDLRLADGLLEFVAEAMARGLLLIGSCDGSHDPVRVTKTVRFGAVVRLLPAGP